MPRKRIGHHCRILFLGIAHYMVVYSLSLQDPLPWHSPFYGCIQSITAGSFSLAQLILWLYAGHHCRILFLGIAHFMVVCRPSLQDPLPWHSPFYGCMQAITAGSSSLAQPILWLYTVHHCRILFLGIAHFMVVCRPSLQDPPPWHSPFYGCMQATTAGSSSLAQPILWLYTVHHCRILFLGIAHFMVVCRPSLQDPFPWHSPFYGCIQSITAGSSSLAQPILWLHTVYHCKILFLGIAHFMVAYSLSLQDPLPWHSPFYGCIQSITAGSFSLAQPILWLHTVYHFRILFLGIAHFMVVYSLSLQDPLPWHSPFYGCIQSITARSSSLAQPILWLHAVYHCRILFVGIAHFMVVYSLSLQDPLPWHSPFYGCIQSITAGSFSLAQPILWLYAGHHCRILFLGIAHFMVVCRPPLQDPLPWHSPFYGCGQAITPGSSSLAQPILWLYTVYHCRILFLGIAHFMVVCRPPLQDPLPWHSPFYGCMQAITAGSLSVAQPILWLYAGHHCRILFLGIAHFMVVCRPSPQDPFPWHSPFYGCMQAITAGSLSLAQPILWLYAGHHCRILFLGIAHFMVVCRPSLQDPFPWHSPFYGCMQAITAGSLSLAQPILWLYAGHHCRIPFLGIAHFMVVCRPSLQDPFPWHSPFYGCMQAITAGSLSLAQPILWLYAGHHCRIPFLGIAHFMVVCRPSLQDPLPWHSPFYGCMQAITVGSSSLAQPILWLYAGHHCRILFLGIAHFMVVCRPSLQDPFPWHSPFYGCMQAITVGSSSLAQPILWLYAGHHCRIPFLGICRPSLQDPFPWHSPFYGCMQAITAGSLSLAQPILWLYAGHHCRILFLGIAHFMVVCRPSLQDPLPWHSAFYGCMQAITVGSSSLAQPILWLYAGHHCRILFLGIAHFMVLCRPSLQDPFPWHSPFYGCMQAITVGSSSLAQPILWLYALQ